MTSIMKANHIYSSLLSNTRIIMFVLASMYSFLCFSQNNPFKINDELYSYYVKCNKEIKNNNVLSMSDTLFNRAQELGDVKAQCLAHTLKLEHYNHKKVSLETMTKHVEEAKRFCAKTPYEQYFYYSWGKLLYYFTKNNKAKEFYDEVNEMYAYACMHHSEYGKYYTDNAIANYWASIQSKSAAISLMKKNLDKLKDDNLRYNSMRLMIIYYLDLENYDEIPKLCNEIEKCKMSNERKAFISCTRTIIACINKDEKNIERYFSEYTKLSKSVVQNNTNTIRKYVANTYYYTYHKQFDKIEESDKIKNDRKVQNVNIYSKCAKGDYLEALSVLKDRHTIENAERDLISIASSLDLTASIEHTNLKTETGRLKVKAAIAHLAETERISKLQAIESEKKRLGIASTHLKAQSQRLTLEKNQLDMRTRLAQINARKKEIEREELTETHLWIVASFLVGLAILSIATLLHERKLKRYIAEEAYKAKSADRMKTAFVKDISKDMAKPLRRIIEGSTKLSVNRNIKHNEKEEIAKDIQANSDYLTDLVNKILASSVKS